MLQFKKDLGFLGNQNLNISKTKNWEFTSFLVNSQFWQGHKDLNPEPTVLETAALPIELYPYIYEKGMSLCKLVGLQGLEPGTIRL